MKESYKSTTRGAIYRKSRYRITAFCALVTGLVLLIAFAVAWQAARRQMSNADESLFLSQCQTVTAYVSSPYGVDTQTVLQFAGQNQLAVAVVDGGTLLTFVPDLQKETLTQLLASVQASAIGRGLYSSAAQSGNFMVQSAGQNWRCFLQGQAMSTTQWCNILVMQPVTVHSAEVLRLLAVYAASFMLGWAALILMSAILARFAVRPIEQAQTEQIRFLASASHELKTPLTVIHADAQLLESEIGENEWLSDIIKQTTNMIEMTHKLVYLARAEEQDNHFVKIEFPISDVAEDVAEPYRSVAQSKGKNYTLDIQEGLSYCGDEKAIRELMTALLDNAFKYSSDGGSISASLAAEGKGVRFTVENTVTDIDPKQLEFFTQRFYRNDTSDKIKGFGIGLSLAQVVAQAHKGKLTVALPQKDLIQISVILK